MLPLIDCRRIPIRIGLKSNQFKLFKRSNDDYNLKEQLGDGSISSMFSRKATQVLHPDVMASPVQELNSDGLIFRNSEMVMLYSALAGLLFLMIFIIIVFFLIKRNQRNIQKIKKSYDKAPFSPGKIIKKHKSERSGFNEVPPGSTMINFGTLGPPNLSRLKVPMPTPYTTTSASSSDNENNIFTPPTSPCHHYAVPLNPITGQKNVKTFQIGPVQPNLVTTKKITNHRSSSSSIDDCEPIDDENGRLPKLTFSLLRKELNDNKDASEASESEYSPTSPKEAEFQLLLVKATNLQRSNTSSTQSAITSAFRSSRLGGHFVPEGVFCRVYKCVNLNFGSGSLRRQSSGEYESCGGAAGGIGSSSDSETFKQTSIIKSKRGKTIKFNSNEEINLKSTDFPIRITLYDVDKQNVRFSLGHCFVNLSPESDIYFASQVILVRNLHRTLYQAKNHMND